MQLQRPMHIRGSRQEQQAGAAYDRMSAQGMIITQLDVHLGTAGRCVLMPSRLTSAGGAPGITASAFCADGAAIALTTETIAGSSAADQQVRGMTHGCPCVSDHSVRTQCALSPVTHVLRRTCHSTRGTDQCWQWLLLR